MSFAHWNAHIRMDGADAQWIGLGWGTEYAGDPKDYFAEITVEAPAEANAVVGKVGINESVTLISREGGCERGAATIPIKVTYRVTRKNPEASDEIRVQINENAGQRATPVTGPLRTAEGEIDSDIVVDVDVPGSCG